MIQQLESTHAVQRKSVLVALSSVAFLFQTLDAQAINCSLAKTPTEKAICSDPELKRLDAQLNRNYGAFKEQYKKTGHYDCLLEDEALTQKTWLTQRDSCGADTACIKKAYDERLAALDAYTRMCVRNDYAYTNRTCAKTAPTATPTAPVASTTSPNPSPAQSCTQADRVDYHFIKENEAMMHDLYVPGPFRTDAITSSKPRASGNNLGPRYKKGGGRAAVVGNSGVTAGSGVDLGQQTEKGLRSYMAEELKIHGNEYPGINQRSIENIMDVLRPFLGLKKSSAVKALDEYYATYNRYPRLSSEESKFLSHAVLHGYTTAAASAYNKNSKIVFSTLPAGAQTVIVDIHYQGYGSVPKGVTAALRNGDWEKSADLLAADTSTYASRNKARASLLRREINAGNLPKSGNPCEQRPPAAK